MVQKTWYNQLLGPLYQVFPKIWAFGPLYQGYQVPQVPRLSTSLPKNAKEGNPPDSIVPISRKEWTYIDLSNNPGAGWTLNMLDQSNDGIKISSLDRISVPFDQELYQKTNFAGKNGKNLMIWNGLSDLKFILYKSWKRQGKERYLPKLYNFKVNKEELLRIKGLYNKTVYNETSPSFVSTNDILTSHIFKYNDKADNVQMAVDMRNRLNILNENLAGNYMYSLYMRKKDLKSPLSVRKCLESRLRVQSAPPLLLLFLHDQFIAKIDPNIVRDFEPSCIEEFSGAMRFSAIILEIDKNWKNVPK